MGRLFRYPPQLPVQAMQTFQVTSPISSHWRDATCDEIDCPNHLHGWATKLDENEPQGQGAQLAGWIRQHCDRILQGSTAAAVQGRRRYYESRDGGLSVFTFPAGQQCFEVHKVPLERPELYIVRDGDWRGNPTRRRRVHSGADPWLDEFSTHQERLARRLQEG